MTWLVLLFCGAMVISGAIGFGSFLLFFAGASFFVEDLRTLLFAMTLGSITKLLTSWWLFRTHVNWASVRRIALYALPMVALGAYLTQDVSAAAFRPLLGLLILTFVELSLLAKSSLTLPLWAQRAWATGWGFLSRFVGAAGPFVVLLLTQLKLQKEAFFGTLQVLFLLSTLVKLPFYTQIENAVTDPHIIGGMLLSGLIGALVGRWLHTKLPQRLFTLAVYALLVYSGGALLLGA